MKHNSLVILLFVVGLLNPAAAFPQPDLDSGLNRTRRDASCRIGLEYQSGNLCCLNCPEGTYVKKPCTTAGGTGQCEECEYGTFIEHASGLTQCFKCTQPRQDQDVLKQCTPTHNAEFQCKPEKFCHPEEACEVCMKCSRCKTDEEVVRNCTPTANTECKKIQPKPGSASGTIATILVLVGIGVVAFISFGIFYFWKRRQRERDSHRHPSDSPKADPLYVSPVGEMEDVENRRSSVPLILPRQLVRIRSPSSCVEEERRILCESLNSSASNSQHSLTCVPAAAPAVPVPSARACPAAAAAELPHRREENFPQLIPVKGEESLRACFEYFEELNVDHYKRFFRSLGISDNVIKSKDALPYEERLHELLNIWMEKVGRDASLNQLLKALLELSQRLTAENIKDRALHDGRYYCEPGV